MKLPIYLTICFFASCSSLTIISPGINSNHRLNKLTDVKFNEAAFYGSTFYQANAFFINHQNIYEILNDPNNIVEKNIKEKFEKNIKNNDVILIAEFCFDKDKFNSSILDFDQYNFKLNNTSFSTNLEVFYLYSAKKKGTSYAIEQPLLVYDKPPNQKNIIKTSFEFIACSRSILNFKNLKLSEGSNKFEIITPRSSQIFFDFNIKNGIFQPFQDEGADLKIGISPYPKN
ncbi:Hypothetical protein LBF_2136 [Leptospira biflexa serovar Patoc strain 'Patoc 1 (Ames)']|uniref:Lipoprotein n=1 Tax=Leptospira biflexa serovar Patoc (strain Patoc 1 / ATCC 23582 / Paris) TaxID=456481 RepID=B0ST57_LEPBP|nr:hypothetical protein [Leptospira biflexa]ABZ94633.1 Hypothetical protein LBF_2136 [Leptospira biflexa serovar Patoc strain 'Patoc 1 (Ames)']ABZ98297.1 Hypothetical protein LEPBI_I2198 [Leptospira biflexa serovar Patoc strain 'Patoc 1 (Paris)']